MSQGLFSCCVIEKSHGGFCVLLDGRRLMTPGHMELVLPARGLADAIAEEWAAQTDTIDPLSMPLTRLANVAVERTPHARAALAEHIQRYGETDLLHHRADFPEALVLRQAQAWDPILEWGVGALGLDLPVVHGVIAPRRDASGLAARALALDDFRLTGLVHAASVFGSAWLAFALMLRRIDAARAVRLARIDDDFQEEHWGQDAHAAAAAQALAADALALERFFTLLDGAHAAI